MSEDDVQALAVERDCAVCLQKCNYPTQLPCGHIFCFLCVKGVAIQSKRCALCREEIPADYLEHPLVLEKLDHIQEDTSENADYHWYYEGRNGWWKYDDRSNAELEEAFSSGQPDCKLLLAGAVYCIQFASMLQVRSRDPTRRRRVCRDLNTLPAKGVAGIKILDNRSLSQDKRDDEETANNNNSNSNDDQREQVVQSVNVPSVSPDDDQLQGSVQHNALHDIVQRISSIDLTNDDDEDENVVDNENFQVQAPEANAWLVLPSYSARNRRVYPALTAKGKEVQQRREMHFLMVQEGFWQHMRARLVRHFL